MKYVGLFAVLLSISIPATAQHAQPYAGLQSRAIKALSEQQIADLRAGRGSGLALAAELNGYPGPAHLLELADQLDLSVSQRERVQTLFAAMKTETVPLGTRLIDQEQELDQLFATRTITLASLTASTQAIGNAQADLRAAHLKYHLSTLELLSPEQIQRYSALRGYGGNQQMPHQHRQH